MMMVSRRGLLLFILLASKIFHPSVAFSPCRVSFTTRRESRAGGNPNSGALLEKKSSNNGEEQQEPDVVEEDEDTPNPINLSDEELLLACRSYLQKKNRLGEWTEFEKRKERRQLQQKVAKQSPHSGGFFWEDPSELKYFRSVEEDQNYSYDHDAGMAEDQQLQNTAESNEKNSMSSSRLEQVAFEFQEDSDKARLEQWSREFSSFPTEPSESRLKRSRAAQRIWEDPAWRAKWYEKRWGSRKKNKTKDEDKKNAKKETGAVTVSFDFLTSDAFNSLSEEEIAEAVAMYTQANAKRADGRKQFLQERKARLTESINQTERVPADALSWDRDPQALKEAQKLREQRARKAYQTRLENKEKTRQANNSTSTPRRISQPFPRGTTSQDALLRIESDLDHGKVPQLQDLELVRHPRKLAKRKILLQRILLEQFGLRGKCVPVRSPKDGSEKMVFITNCTVNQLVAFVMDKVREYHEGK